MTDLFKTPQWGEEAKKTMLDEERATGLPDSSPEDPPRFSDSNTMPMADLHGDVADPSVSHPPGTKLPFSDLKG